MVYNTLLFISDKQYKLNLSSSSPAVLDSIINFHAYLLVQGREVTNKTLFIYNWWNSANEHLFSTEANYESDIDEKSFYSTSIKPGIYSMTVCVYKKAPIIEVACGSVNFNLTGKLFLSKTSSGVEVTSSFIQFNSIFYLERAQ